MIALFYVSLGVILYTYFGYPMLLMIRKLVACKPVAKQDIRPTVSVLIPAYNEELHIEARIKNILRADYPRDLMEILIGCDGCTDETVRIVERLAETRTIRFRVSRDRIGKPAMLNVLAREAGGKIFVFADARQRFEPEAIRELVRCFGDEQVGCVSGELVIVDRGDGTGRGVGLYWSYEVWLRKLESATGSMLGATGAIYAIRREFFRDLPNDVLLDDVYTPMRAIMAGKRSVFEPAARAIDTASESVEKEFTRKIRTLVGNFQIFSLFKSAFNPLRSPIAWRLFSHKLLRLALSYLLVLLFVLSIRLAGRGFPYLLALVAQIAFYGVACAGGILEAFHVKVRGALRAVYVPYEFCVLNAAAVVALYRYLSGGIDVKWRK
jgi:poly-beta-1,6-N-acetyl-D-glucosamine synthase